MPTDRTSALDIIQRSPASDQVGDWHGHFVEVAPRWPNLRARAAEFRAQQERYYQYCIPEGSRVLELGSATGELLASLKPSHGVGVDFVGDMVARAEKQFSDLHFVVAEVEELTPEQLPGDEPFDYIILDNLVGCVVDVEYLLHRVATLCAPHTRVIISYHNALYESVFGIVEKLGIRRKQPVQNWIGDQQMANLLRLAGFHLVRLDHRHFFPFNVPVVTHILERVVGRLPLFRHLCLMSYAVARFVPQDERTKAPSVSVICPCRNEAGNIPDAARRLPKMGDRTELIFVEGNSSDNTLEVCQQVVADYPKDGPLELSLIEQGDGRGKGDAVRKGFAAATGDILMILDADLTVPPEDLPKFYHAIVEERGEIINGTRLVYPMEAEAMRFLNKLGNKFFSILFTWTLGQPITDTLCGTKVMWKEDYERLAANRAYFGEFDPFGDFDLLFGSAKLGLELIEVPIRYRDRTYGSTNIDRFRHGLLLLKMSWLAIRKIRFR